MARVRVNVGRGRAPVPAVTTLNREVIFGVTGTTIHTPPDGAPYTVPPVGQLFLMATEADHVRAGSYAEGTLGQAVAAIEAQGNWRIAAVRHDENALAFYAGVSDDGAAAAAELSIAGTGGRATIGSYAGNKHHLIAVPATEPDITRVFYSSDAASNVIGDFTKAAGTVVPQGDTREHNVWVSNAASALAVDVTISVGIMTAVQAMERLESVGEALDILPNRIATADRAHNVNAMGQVDNSAGNALVAKTEEVCTALRALGYVSGPGGSNMEFTDWLAANRSERLYGCAPYLALAGEPALMGMAPAWAAAHAAKVRDIGFWANPHGGGVKGVDRLQRPILFDPLSDSASSSIITAANGVSMFRRDGYHLLGSNLMVDPASEDAIQQGSARLILDDVRLHAGAAGSRALEENVGPDIVDFVANIARNRLAFLLGVRAINSGSVRPDTELNTPEALAAGDINLIIDYDAVKNVRNVNFNIYHT